MKHIDKPIRNTKTKGDKTMSKLTIKQAIDAFYNESFDLVFASEATARKASDKINNGDLYQRWFEYNDEVLEMYYEEQRAAL